jgi:glycosyltransferase involved in cell wall biosynthesis
LKILYHHRVGSRDGQAVHIDELIHAFRSLGHEVVVVAPPGFERSPLGHESRVVAWIKQRLPQAFYELIELSYNVPAYLRLRRALRQCRADLIYERHALFLVAGTLLGRRKRVPAFLEVNSPLADERAQFGGLALKRLAHWLEIWAWRRAGRVLPVTQVLAETIRAAGVPPDRISVLPNGIDPERFLRDYSSTLAKDAVGLSGKTVLGFTGFMRSWHGLETIIEVLGRSTTPTSLHLLLIGDGPARPLLEQRAAQLNVMDRVTFAGLVKRDDIAQLMAAFDIALVPKAVEYASPLKLFEYMALGKAIVAPDQPNIREVLTPNVNAVLFEPEQANDMASAILRLANDVGYRDRLGKAARAAIDARGFTWAANAERIVALAQQHRRTRPVAEPVSGSEGTAIAGRPSTGHDRRS